MLAARTPGRADKIMVLGPCEVFWNLLKNSVKFTPREGQITVSSQMHPGRNEISVSVLDTGIGMDPPELDRVFSAFAQGDHAQQGRSHRFGGLGLGLAISRKLIEMHAGRIEARSEGKGHGAMFTVFLPGLPGGIQNASKLPSPPRRRQPWAAIRLSASSGEDHEATADSDKVARAAAFEVVSPRPLTRT